MGGVDVRLGIDYIFFLSVKIYKKLLEDKLQTYLHVGICKGYLLRNGYGTSDNF